MKNLAVFALFLLFALAISSCKKSSVKPALVSIVGNWKLVSDSGYVDGGNVPPEPHTYKGTASDHYNFQPGGKLLWYENDGGSDSATYTLRSRDTVTIAYLPKSDPNYTQDAVATYTITILTADKMVLVLDGGPIVEDIMTFSR